MPSRVKLQHAAVAANNKCMKQHKLETDNRQQQLNRHSATSHHPQHEKQGQDSPAPATSCCGGCRYVVISSEAAAQSHIRQTRVPGTQPARHLTVSSNSTPLLHLHYLGSAAWRKQAAAPTTPGTVTGSVPTSKQAWDTSCPGPQEPATQLLVTKQQATTGYRHPQWHTCICTPTVDHLITDARWDQCFMPQCAP